MSFCISVGASKLRCNIAIPILQRHLNFLVEKHALYTTGEQLKAEALGDIFSTSWSREAIEDVVSKGAGHLMEVCHFPVV